MDEGTLPHHQIKIHSCEEDVSSRIKQAVAISMSHGIWKNVKLTPCSMVHLKKLLAAQTVNFPSFYGT
jgi:hypothetical protein